MGELQHARARLSASPDFPAEERAEHADMGESADVDIAAAALPRGGAAGVGGEELPVTLLDVGVAVPARGEHEVEITLQIIVRVIAAARDERFDEHLAELEIQRVFAGVQELMIVNAALPPVLRLVMQDVAAFIQRRVRRAPEDAAGCGFRGAK